MAPDTVYNQRRAVGKSPPLKPGLVYFIAPKKGWLLLKKVSADNNDGEFNPYGYGIPGETLKIQHMQPIFLANYREIVHEYCTMPYAPTPEEREKYTSRKLYRVYQFLWDSGLWKYSVEPFVDTLSEYMLPAEKFARFNPSIKKPRKIGSKYQEILDKRKLDMDNSDPAK